jgi:hypothetical protein
MTEYCLRVARRMSLIVFSDAVRRVPCPVFFSHLRSLMATMGTVRGNLVESGKALV